MTTPGSTPPESTVENHIESTSRLVRQVDIMLSILVVASMVFGGLFLAVIADHWLLKEGLSIPLRLGVFSALFAGVGCYIYWRVVPLFRYSINPVFTADLIERDTPVFKNSLINWLLLRRERIDRADQPDNKISERMFDGVVQTAAANVQTVPEGHAVDLHKLIWSGTFFAFLLVLFIAYAAFSPKNPFISLLRVLIPVSSIERPQAARFVNVKPGNATILQGETITISAEVISQSLEPVYLVFSTDDGQAVNQRIPMSQPDGKIAFETFFPPGKQGTERGFNSGVNYRIMQGESRSPQYRIEVLPAASIEIISLQYKFPDYTGLPPETLEQGGDIRALEGTEVTVAVRSTLPLHEIDLVYDDNPASRVPMTLTDAQQTEAKGTFALKMPFSHKSFSFRAKDANGNASRRSGICQIEVIPDQPPKVQWADTATALQNVAQLDLPLNKTLQLPIQAEDPDFALRFLIFKMESAGKRIPDVALLASPSSGPTEHKGQIKKPITFSPEEKRLAVGDTAEIWVEARDTKLPEANISTTRRIKVHIVDADTQKDDPNEDREKKGEGESEKDNGEKHEDKGNSGNQNQNKDNTGDGQGGQSDQDDSEQSGRNPKEEQGGKDNPGQSPQEQEGQQEQKGVPGQGDQQKGKDESDQGKTGNERTGSDNKGSEERNDGGGQEQGNESGKDETADQQQAGNNENRQNGGKQQEAGEGKGGETKSENVGGEQQNKNTEPLNPDTQDGDAMERIVDQMKQEGLFPGANPFLRNDNSFLRDDSQDPNSKNRSKTGNDPSNPKGSNQPSEGNPQNKPPGQPDKSSGEKQDQGQPKPGEKDAPQDGNADPSQNKEQGKSDGQPSGSQPQSPEGSESGDESPESSQSGRESGDGGQDSDPGQQSQGNSQSNSQGNPQDNSSANSPNNSPGNGNATGLPQGSTGGGNQLTRETTPDDPNLKYANEVTDLVLEYLENQLKDKPNDKLLKKLGWTEDQLRQFYDKWQKMAKESKQPQQREDGKNDWLEALKSTGLLPNQRRVPLQGGQTRVKDTTRSTETQRYAPPSALKDRAKRYNEGIGEGIGK